MKPAVPGGRLSLRFGLCLFQPPPGPNEKRVIHPQAFDGGPSLGCLPFKDGWILDRPLEVLAPAFRARTEQRGHLAGRRVPTVRVRPFVPVTPTARERKVLKDRLPAVVLGNDVINMKGGYLSMGRNLTILAAAACPLGNGLPKL